MACRGCSSSDGCGCSVIGDGAGISVSGTGTPVTGPYIVALDLADALSDQVVDDATACGVLNDPHVPVLLGTGNVVMVPLPCNSSLSEQLPGQAFGFTFNATAGDTPGDAFIQFDDTTYADVVEISVNTQEINGTDVTDWLESLTTGMFRVYSRSDVTVWAVYTIDGAPSTAGDVVTFTVTYVDGVGTFDTSIPGDTVLDYTGGSGGGGGGGGGDPYAAAQNVIDLTGAFGLSIGDEGVYYRLANASPFSVTVPNNSTEAFAVGTRIDFIQSGAGQITFAAAGGVTINAAPGLKLNGQWAGATLVKVDTNTWDLIGNLTS